MLVRPFASIFITGLCTLGLCYDYSYESYLLHFWTCSLKKGALPLSAPFKKKSNALDRENAQQVCVLLNVSTHECFQMENYVLLSILNIFLIRLFTSSFCQNDDKEDLLQQQLAFTQLFLNYKNFKLVGSEVQRCHDYSCLCWVYTKRCILFWPWTCWL